MKKDINTAFSGPQMAVTRGRPRKYPASNRYVRITDLCRSVLRAFRRFLISEKIFARNPERFQRFNHEYIEEGEGKKRKRRTYNKSYIDEMFKHQSFTRKFKKWVQGDDKTVKKLKPKALEHAKFLAETR